LCFGAKTTFVGLDDRYPGKRDDSDAYADYHKRENRELGLRQTWGNNRTGRD